MNGRGDDTMTMLQGYAHMVDFFTSFEWWKTEPHDEVVNPGNYCLAVPGEIYAAYLPHGGWATIRLQEVPIARIGLTLPVAKDPSCRRSRSGVDIADRARQ